MIAVALAGCADNGDPAGPGDGKDTTGVPVAPPKTGSSFVLHSYQTDINGVRIDSTDITDTIRVVQEGLALGGKRDAVALKSGRDTSTLYLHYDANGDFSMMQGSRDHWALQWRTFPVATKGKTGLPTIREAGSQGRTDIRNDSMYYQGTEDVTVAGTTYACHKILNLQTHANDKDDAYGRYTRYYWYAPAAKMFVKYDEQYEIVFGSTGSVYFRAPRVSMYMIAQSLK